MAAWFHAQLSVHLVYAADPRQLFSSPCDAILKIVVATVLSRVLRLHFKAFLKHFLFLFSVVFKT